MAENQIVINSPRWPTGSMQARGLALAMVESATATP